MREEAKIEEWKEIYDVALNIKKLEPWNFLWNMQIITIKLPGESEPYFCSILGKDDGVTGISIYSGYEAIEDVYRLANNKETPYEQLVRYQNCITCYFGNRDELTNKELKLVKEMGYKFRGKGNWIYLRSVKNGYLPYMLNKEEVEEYTEVLKNLYMALRAVLLEGLQINFEEGNTLLRLYDEKSKLWLNVEVPMKLPALNKGIAISDELLLARLKKTKKSNMRIELDIANSGVAFEDKSYDRPLEARLVVIADRETGEILKADIFIPDDDEIATLLKYLCDFIFEYGIPSDLYVRDDKYREVLRETCRMLSIRLKERELLRGIDNFIESYREGLN